MRNTHHFRPGPRAPPPFRTRGTSRRDAVRRHVTTHRPDRHTRLAVTVVAQLTRPVVQWNTVEQGGTTRRSPCPCGTQARTMQVSARDVFLRGVKSMKDGRAADACVCARDTRKRGRTQAQPAASSPSDSCQPRLNIVARLLARRYVTAIHVASPGCVRARGRVHMFANICGRDPASQSYEMRKMFLSRSN